MGVIGTAVITFIATQFLETYPNIGLDMLHHMPEMNRTIGIRQSGSNKYFSLGHGLYRYLNRLIGEKLGSV